MKKIAIIGGGASGLAAAVTAASCKDASVVLFEASDRVGKSILASGNGRCNFSNAQVLPEVYYHAEFVEKSMKALSRGEVWSFFRDLGLVGHEEDEGRLYPVTNKASSVLDVLRFAAEDNGVEVRCGSEVLAVTPTQSRFLVMLKEGATFFFDVVIIACGGKVARSLVPPTYGYHNTQPLLGPLKTDTTFLKGLNNVRAHAAIESATHHERGEILFREYGISGIAVFNMSRFVRAGDEVHLDFFPQNTINEFETFLHERHHMFQKRTALTFCAGMMQQPLARAVLKRAGIEVDAPLDSKDITALAQTAKRFTLIIQGGADYQRCQVQRGGFALENINPHTMESNHNPGLFIVGEALDVDGPCGGYNLHWAWTSGIIAGRRAAQTTI